MKEKTRKYKTEKGSIFTETSIFEDNGELKGKKYTWVNSDGEKPLYGFAYVPPGFDIEFDPDEIMEVEDKTRLLKEERREGYKEGDGRIYFLTNDRHKHRGLSSVVTEIDPPFEKKIKEEPKKEPESNGTS